MTTTTSRPTRQRRAPRATPTKPPKTARVVLDSAISEKAFQAQVIQLAELNNWMVYHPFDSRRSTAGYPDLTLCRPFGKGSGATHYGELIFVELKREGGRVSPAQTRWLTALSTAARVYVWFPHQWSEIERVLSGRDAKGAA